MSGAEGHRMGPKIVPIDQATAQRWRNGGGVTRELLAWPAAADWILRLSVADIAQDGPFSAFPGIERWFAVLAGAGVRLGQVTITADGPIHRFDGAEAPDCRLLDGPTRDLNLMIRRDRAHGSLRRLTPGERWRPAAPLHGLFTLAPGGLACGDGAPVALPGFALAWADDPAPVDWCCEAAAFAFECAPHEGLP